MAGTQDDLPADLSDGWASPDDYKDRLNGRVVNGAAENPVVSISKQIKKDREDSNWAREAVWIEGATPIWVGTEQLRIDPSSLHNQGLIMLNHPDLTGCFAYDIFADEVKIVKCPPWDDPASFKVRKTTDADLTQLRRWFETLAIRGKLINLSESNADRLVEVAAKKNSVNPPLDYFKSLEWDGVPRLDRWLISYLGAEDQPVEYLSLVGRKWLVGAVTRVFEPGAAFDFAMILQGKQRIGKSKALERLATVAGVRYFTDESLNFRHKDSAMACQGKLIVEMAELASWSRADERDIKAFITRRVDEYRPHYARKFIERPRMFVLAGTVNPIGGEIFSDPTGNTRYWPVKCGKIDLDALDEVKEQLWAEAVHRYNNKEQLYLKPKEFALATQEQEQAMIRDVWETDILRAIDEIEKDNLAADREIFDRRIGRNSGLYTVNEIMDKMKIPTERKTNYYRQRIRISLERLGYEETKRSKQGHREICYMRKLAPLTPEWEDEESEE